MSLPAMEEVCAPSMPWGVLRPKPQRVSAAMHSSVERPLFWPHSCSVAADKPDGASTRELNNLQGI